MDEMKDFFEWAKRRGYSMKDLHRALGYDLSTIYRYRRGEIKNTTNFKFRAVAAFGEAVRDIFFDNGIHPVDG